MDQKDLKFESILTVASLGAAQTKDGLTTLEVTLINWDYQPLWH